MNAEQTARLVTTVYEQDGAWAAADGMGDEIASGLASRQQAERVAAAWALRMTEAWQGEEGPR